MKTVFSMRPVMGGLLAEDYTALNGRPSNSNIWNLADVMFSARVIGTSGSTINLGHDVFFHSL